MGSGEVGVEKEEGKKVETVVMKNVEVEEDVEDDDN